MLPRASPIFVFPLREQVRKDFSQQIQEGSIGFDDSSDDDLAPPEAPTPQERAAEMVQAVSTKTANVGDRINPRNIMQHARDITDDTIQAHVPNMQMNALWNSCDRLQFVGREICKVARKPYSHEYMTPKQQACPFEAEHLRLRRDQFSNLGGGSPD